MHYYIDGYNLLFRTLQPEASFEEQRKNFLEDLNEKIAFLNLNVTVVFDAHYRFGESEKGWFKSCRVIFTSYGETADEAIIKEIEGEPHPKRQVVVTSDKKLAWFARRVFAKTESVEEFISWLNERYKNRKAAKSKKQPRCLPLLRFKKLADSSDPSKKSAVECFDYYLEEFQKRSSEDKPMLKQKHAPLKKAKGKSQEEEVSSFLRWLRLFEKKLDEESH